MRLHRRAVQLALVALVEVLVLAVWFSASVAVPALRDEWHLSTEGAIWLTAVVQLGFAVGAVGSSLLSWFPGARSLALGVVLGALALGSALAQLINAVGGLPWRGVLAAAAALAFAGGLIALGLVRAGPHGAASPPLQPRYVIHMFRDRPQRLINLGYFGHMWELYGLWTWLPTYIAASYAAWSPSAPSRAAVGLTAFVVIGVAGAAGCLLGGAVADRHGRARVAMTAMLISATCSVVSVAVFGTTPAVVVALLVVWGAAAIADSAQFSAALPRPPTSATWARR